MKFFSLFLLIIAISILTVSLRKVIKKVKKDQTTLNAEVSTKSFALKDYGISIIIDGKDNGTGSFSVNSLIKPKGDEILGLMFKLEKEPTEDMKKLFVPKEDYYYLPYRSISEDILYVNPFGKPKRFEITVTNDKQEIHYIRIILPYADTHTFINDEEANLLRGLINDLRVKMQARLNNYKKNAGVEASHYINVKPLLNNANKSEEAFRETVKISESESEALAVIIQNDTEAYNEVKSKYDQIEKEYTELRNKLCALNEKISDTKNLRLFKDSSAKKFKGQKAEAVKSTLSQDLEKYENEFNNALAKITANIPSKSTDLEEARKQILENLNLEKYMKIVEGVYSGN